MPGSFELPVVAKAMAKSGKFDAVVAIGAVVSTPAPPAPSLRPRTTLWAPQRNLLRLMRNLCLY